LEETHKVKHFKKVENKPSEEVAKTHVCREKQPKKVEDKSAEDKHKTYVTNENHSTLTRSMSTSSLLESPSALSRKVSSMSKRVKETLGKVMAGTLELSNLSCRVAIISIRRRIAVVGIIAYRLHLHSMALGGVTGCVKCDRACTKSTKGAFLVPCSSC